MKPPHRRFWLGLLLLLVPASYGGWVGYQRYLWWDTFERPIVWDQWGVTLPAGGSVTYRGQAPRVRLAGPADTQKFLLWERPDGRTQDYSMGMVGAGYQDIEFRLRADGKALWLLSWDQHKIAATLDLQNGNFTDGGGNVTQWGEEGANDSGPTGLPKWANWHSGRSLGRKKF